MCTWRGVCETIFTSSERSVWLCAVESVNFIYSHPDLSPGVNGRKGPEIVLKHDLQFFYTQRVKLWLP